MTERITSRQNPLCRHVKKLQSSRAYRYEQRQFLCDGGKLAQEALRWGCVRTLILREDVKMEGLPEDLRTVLVPESVMKELSRMDTPQGVLAICEMPMVKRGPIQPGSLILDGIQDPGNLGTILRTADAFEVPVILTEGCADPYGEKTVRASMGAVLRTPPRQQTVESILSDCREHGVHLCVTALTEQAKDLRSAQLNKVVTVIGSEGQGVRQEFLDSADETVIIPMAARCESLNAAVAAAIVLWEQRRGIESN